MRPLSDAECRRVSASFVKNRRAASYTQTFGVGATMGEDLRESFLSPLFLIQGAGHNPRTMKPLSHAAS
jgi:hypothetical protein